MLDIQLYFTENLITAACLYSSNHNMYGICIPGKQHLHLLIKI